MTGFLGELRQGQGPLERDMTHKTGFDITVSSEIMAARPSGSTGFLEIAKS